MWLEWDCTCITDWNLFVRVCFKKDVQHSGSSLQGSVIERTRKNRVESRRQYLGSLVFSESNWVKGGQQRRSSSSKVLILKTATIVRRTVLQELQFKDWQFSLIKVERGDPLVEVRSLSKGQATFHSFSTETFTSSRRSQECLKIKQKTAFLISIIKEKGTG